MLLAAKGNKDAHIPSSWSSLVGEAFHRRRSTNSTFFEEHTYDQIIELLSALPYRGTRREHGLPVAKSQLDATPRITRRWKRTSCRTYRTSSKSPVWFESLFQTRSMHKTVGNDTHVAPVVWHLRPSHAWRCTHCRMFPARHTHGTTPEHHINL